jgi:hypothetical protein
MRGSPAPLAFAAAVVALTVACGRDASPVAPSLNAAPGAAGGAGVADATGDGALKVSQPVPRSPVGGEQPRDFPLTLVAANASPLYVDRLTPASSPRPTKAIWSAASSTIR